jgi:hypothetical protein
MRRNTLDLCQCIACQLKDAQGHCRSLKARNPKTDVSKEAANIVNLLFLDLQSIFPAWKASFPNDTLLQRAKKNWVKGFIENNVHTEQQVQRGLRKARQSTSPYFPSVGEFVGWCLGDYEWVRIRCEGF